MKIGYWRIARWILWVILAAGHAQSVHAWDFPLEITPVAMKFNHGYSNGALAIRVNASTDVTVPEYYPYRNDPCAYVMGDSPKVLAMFWTDSADTPSITIDAVASGDTSWELADKTMTFNPGSGYSHTDSIYSSETNYQMFDTASGFPGAVGKYEVSWTWRVVAVNETPREPETVGYTSHTLYTLLDTPVSFYFMTYGETGIPWADVLDLSCEWASGETSYSACISKLTQGLYEYSGLHYTQDSMGHASGDVLYLQYLLDEIAAPSQAKTNCVAYANFLNVLAYSIGMPSSVVGFIQISRQSQRCPVRSLTVSI